MESHEGVVVDSYRTCSHDCKGSCRSGVLFRVHSVGHMRLVACRGYSPCLLAKPPCSVNVSDGNCTYSTGMYCRCAESCCFHIP